MSIRDCNVQDPALNLRMAWRAASLYVIPIVPPTDFSVFSWCRSAHWVQSAVETPIPPNMSARLVCPRPNPRKSALATPNANSGRSTDNSEQLY